MCLPAGGRDVVAVLQRGGKRGAEEGVAADPLAVRPLGTAAEVAGANGAVHLVEELGVAGGGRGLGGEAQNAAAVPDPFPWVCGAHSPSSRFDGFPRYWAEKSLSKGCLVDEMGCVSGRRWWVRNSESGPSVTSASLRLN